MKNIDQLADELGLKNDEYTPYGNHIGKLDFKNILKRHKHSSQGKYIDVTAITPTPLGEGKTTTTIGLIQALGKLNKKVTGAIRQPSSGPTFNIKGSAGGGGLAHCVPLSEFSLGLTGDFDAITNAHNLGMVALTSRLQHEFNYSDKALHLKHLKRLDIDPRNITVKWAIDLCAQSLREIIIGFGDKTDGFMLQSGFQISVSSELMAILSIATSLKDMREGIAKMIVAYSKDNTPITTKDLEVDGAMAALLSKAIAPNLLQTLEGQPLLVHCGPFANIALGQSSIIADQVGLKLADYHVTESGFGADIGFEKFWNIKCRISKLIPDCIVLVVTIRALKMHGGGPPVIPGKPLADEYTHKNLSLLEQGMENLWAHIDIIEQSGLSTVVCINHFNTDYAEEINYVEHALENSDKSVAVSKHFEQGGDGAIRLAEAVIDACNKEQNFKFLYPESISVEEKIKIIATNVYGAKEISYSPAANEKLKHINQDKELKNFQVCMAKTPLSLSDNPIKKGRPENWRLFIRDILIYAGAGLLVPVTGSLKLMPGTASDPAFRHIDIDTESGDIRGLF
ncbi:MAG: formate--tetrahydrofolate ligase [Gammaproteobacteria bacterium]|nr:formate--tetrahydrofolate ligase [Gammaproteobacteria bacterium]